MAWPSIRRRCSSRSGSMMRSYDTRASDNEEESARWARDVVVASGGPPLRRAGSTTSIIATKHDSDSIRGDAALVADIDLTILGSLPDRFQIYDRQIRQEYAWVPEPDFREARLRILEGFLARPTIYLTGPFRRKYEAQARENLETAVAELRENPSEPAPMPPSLTRVLETALYSDDLERARQFYSGVLGLKVLDQGSRLVSLDAGQGTVLTALCIAGPR